MEAHAGGELKESKYMGGLGGSGRDGELFVIPRVGHSPYAKKQQSHRFAPQFILCKQANRTYHIR